MQKDLILGEILKKYGSQKSAAEALGISEQAFSHALSRMSKKFLLRLKTIGIVIYDNAEQNKLTVNETLVTYQANRIMQLEKENKELKEENAKLRMLGISINKKDKGASVK